VKKAKLTPQAGGKSVREKSQATHTSKKSCSQHTEYFVRVVKDKRTGLAFLTESGGVTFLLTKMIRESL